MPLYIQTDIAKTPNTNTKMAYFGSPWAIDLRALFVGIKTHTHTNTHHFLSIPNSLTHVHKRIRILHTICTFSHLPHSIKGAHQRVESLHHDCLVLYDKVPFLDSFLRDFNGHQYRRGCVVCDRAQYLQNGVVNSRRFVRSK